MAYKIIPQGLLWGTNPPWSFSGATPLWGHVAIGTMDGAAEKNMAFGHVYIDGRPTSAKTISSSGGKLHIRTATVTWATAGTTVRVGLQDPSTSSGPPLQPDGTFDVYGDLVQGSDSLSSNTWTTVTMSSGTKDIAHGDLVCLVCDMTTRNGADSVQIACFSAARPGVPGCNLYTTFWASSMVGTPNCIIEFDDGTLGWFDGGGYSGVITATNESFQDSTNPDERGMIFRVPWNCKIDAAYFGCEFGAAAADATLYLYADPLGTPTSLQSWAILGEQDPGNLHNPFVLTVPSGGMIALSKDTDYCLALKATGTSVLSIQPLEFASATYRKTTLLGADAAYCTRNGGSGAFSTTTTKLMYLWGVRICAIGDGAAPTYQLGI